MADIKVNDELLKGISEQQQQRVILELKKYGVMKDGDVLVGDTNTPKPSSETVLFSQSVTYGDLVQTTDARVAGFPGNLIDGAKDILTPAVKPVCQGLCDGVALAAVAALTLTGPELVLALAGIEYSRTQCRDRC